MAAGLRQRLLRGHAPRQVLLDFECEVSLDFRMQVIGETAPAGEKTGQFRPPLPHGVTHGDQASGARMRPMASTNRRHFDVAAASCLRPAGVSR